MKDACDAYNIGHHKQPSYWVYLCGLTSDFYSQEEVANRQELDKIGKKLNIKIVHCCPVERAPQFDNKLHWPHDIPHQTLRTYNQIKSSEIAKLMALLAFPMVVFFLINLSNWCH